MITLFAWQRLIILLIVVQVHGVFAQKREYFMLVDSSLLANGVRYPIKSKVFLKGNYLRDIRFGDYLVESTKRGPSFQRGKELFFFRYQVENSVMFSYVLTRASDSVVINSMLNTNSREFYISNGQSSYSDLRESIEHYYSVLKLVRLEETWELEMKSRIGSRVKGLAEVNGIVRSASQEINIRPVNYLANGKKGIAGSLGANPIYGYELVYNNLVIAAYQVGLTGAPKPFVWLRNDLPPGLEMISAATITAILMMIGEGHFQEMY